MTRSTTNSSSWSPWHLRLHKKLLAQTDLIPKRSCVLLAVSGGQDSMVLLKLMLDLQRLHQWKLQVWHGDHHWHNKSSEFAKELQSWCRAKNLDFFYNRAKKEEARTETEARNWRYKCLSITAEILSSADQSSPCNHVITGHTGSDRAETLLLNLARGSGIAGISSLEESRQLTSKIKLVRPLLSFSRDETEEICQQLKLPIWIDPSNKNINLSRNRVRKQVIPVLEDLHPGCSMRMASLAERLSQYKKDQNAMAVLLIESLQRPEGLCRKSLSNLPFTARATILAEWLKQHNVPSVTAKQLEELSHKIEKSKPPGCSHLAQKWKLLWECESIQLIHPN